MKKIKTTRVTDKMRIDWFQATPNAWMFGKEGKFGWDVSPSAAQHCYGKTLRQAIDAAIRREKKR